MFPFHKQWRVAVTPLSLSLYRAIASVHSRLRTAICLQTSIRCVQFESKTCFTFTSIPVFETADSVNEMYTEMLNWFALGANRACYQYANNCNIIRMCTVYTHDYYILTITLIDDGRVRQETQFRCRFGEGNVEENETALFSNFPHDNISCGLSTLSTVNTIC